jgi:hypothetical protein
MAQVHQDLRAIVDDAMKTLVYKLQTELGDNGRMSAPDIIHTLDKIGYRDLALECEAEWDMDLL